MKKTVFAALLGLIFCLVSGLGGCQKKGFELEGELVGGANLGVVLQKASFTQQQPDAISKTDADGSGKFKIELEQPLTVGIYIVKAGQKQVVFILDGSEKKVTVKSDLNKPDQSDAEISGSETATAYHTAVKKMIAEKLTPDAIQTLALEQKNALVGATVAMSLSRNAVNYIPFFQKINEKLSKDMPASPYATGFADFLTKVQNAKMKSQMTEQSAAGIAVGAAAPDIQLPDPTGKMRSLSSLKGKVVLLDFWASWCGPCRKENPHVVEVYKKYKGKGFDIFSVSLDGLDPRRAAGIDPAQAEQAKENGRKAWQQAIKQDGLLWENHVSDLQHWAAAPAATYGVQSIPKTFLIGRDGKIAAINPRQNLEEAVKAAL